jgi:hypothetical protein
MRPYKQEQFIMPINVNVSLDAFTAAAGRNARAENAVLRVTGDGSVHRNSALRERFTTRAAHRETMGQFLDALEAKFGEDIANMAIRGLKGDIDSGKPLTARVIHLVVGEAMRLRESLAVFLSGHMPDGQPVEHNLDAAIDAWQAKYPDAPLTPEERQAARENMTDRLLVGDPVCHDPEAMFQAVSSVNTRQQLTGNFGNVPRGDTPLQTTIDRNAEITAMEIGRQFAAHPDRKDIRQGNMNASSQEIRSRVKEGDLREFMPGWAIIGDKPGGVEGGFMVRRVYTGDMANFFQDSPEGFAQLQKMSQENSRLLPAEFQAKNLGGKTLLEAFSKLDANQRNTMVNRVMDLTPAYRKSYMVKVVFGKDDVEGGGTVFCKPNPKGIFHRLFTKRFAREINKEVLQEFAALQVARALSPELAPEAILGKVKTNGYRDRYFLMTEMAGSGDRTASFQTLGDVNVEENGVDSEFAGFSYALTVGLLGDRDANKDGNLGLLKRGDGLPKPFLFDLGHPNPNGYKLDTATLLPKKTSEGSTGFYLGKLNKSDVLSVDDRRAHLENLLEHRTEVGAAMQQAIGQLPPDSPEAKVLEDMRNEFAKRMEYLGKILEIHAPN